VKLQAYYSDITQLVLLNPNFVESLVGSGTVFSLLPWCAAQRDR
jgi:hypothetical protein